MRNDPFSRSSQGPQRRGLFGNIRWWVLLLAAGYALFYTGYPTARSIRTPARR